MEHLHPSRVKHNVNVRPLPSLFGLLFSLLVPPLLRLRGTGVGLLRESLKTPGIWSRGNWRLSLMLWWLITTTPPEIVFFGSEAAALEYRPPEAVVGPWLQPSRSRLMKNQIPPPLLVVDAIPIGSMILLSVLLSVSLQN